MPGHGGTNEGEGKAELTWGEESDDRNARFREVVLPPGFLDDPKDDVAGTTRHAPEVEPADTAPRAARQAVESATGGETWNLRLRPKHRTVVQKYFGRHDD